MNPLHLLWLLFPAAAVLFHFSSGEILLAQETAGKLRAEALALETAGRPQGAKQSYQAAFDAAHVNDVPLRTRLRIDIARAAILSGEAFEGIELMEKFLAQRSFRGVPKALRREARAVCAIGLYFAAYALRLDNTDPTLWSEEAAEARSLFETLHREALQAGFSDEAALHARNLEATIQLQRFKLAEIALNPPPPASLAARDKSIFRKKLERLDQP